MTGDTTMTTIQKALAIIFILVFIAGTGQAYPGGVGGDAYGQGACECPSPNEQMFLVFSQERPFDLVELEQLLQSVGWSHRPLQKVRSVLDNSLLKVGLWRHDPSFPRLIGFARCTGDGVIEATVWDVAIHPIYQGFGLGLQLMSYVNKSLKLFFITELNIYLISIFGVLSLFTLLFSLPLNYKDWKKIQD